VSERRRLEWERRRELSERLELERLVGEVSAAFVNLTGQDLGPAIHGALDQIGEALDLDRCSLYEPSGVDDFVLTHRWSRAGEPDGLPAVSAARQFPWTVKTVLKGECAAFSSPDEIPDADERETVRELRLASRVSFPLSIGDRLLGVLCFASVRQPRRWPDGIVTRLRLIAQVFASALARERANAALQASEARFRSLADHAPVLIWVSGLDKGCTWVNQQWLDFVGQTMEHELGEGWTAGVHPDDFHPCMSSYVAAFDARRPFTIEFRLRRHDRTWRWVLASGAPNFTANGVFEGFIGSCVDVTETREANMRLQSALDGVQAAERAVRAQFERLDLLHRITRSIGGREDLGSIYQVVLRAVEENIGFDLGCMCDYDVGRHELMVAQVSVDGHSAEQLALAGQSRIPVEGPELEQCVAGQLFYDADLPVATTPFRRRLAQAGLGSMVAAPLRVESSVFGVFIVARRSRHGFSTGECEFLQRLSEHVALAAHQSELYSALQNAYDDLRHSQDAVMDQERLRVIGQMASGIAHDINNGISPVSLYTETILEHETGLSEEGREYLRIIQRSVEDVGQTLARLSEFARQRESTLTLVPLDMNALVEQVRGLTRARWKDMPLLGGQVIDLRTDLAPDLPLVLGVEAEVREALANLVINAVDAMPSGGTLTLRTRAETRSTGPGRPVRPVVELEVTDTGAGMDEDTRRRCLEPFFTTKGARGTGLGLAMVYGVVQRHNAQMDIDSAVGRGTTVRISFPQRPQARVAHEAAESIPTPSRARILIVDDDPLLIRSLREVLERDGHDVVTAGGGSEGIDAFHRSQHDGRAFDLILTDLAMPHLDGYKVAAAVKRRSPSTCVMLLTGWGRLLADERLPPNVDRILSKPPRLQELRGALAWAAARGRV
jgi:PAS domain S-box-containing protein